MNILVVDDEKEIADVVELYLQNDQYKVFKFYNGQDALDCINSTKIDLAILDIMLPDIDGFQILKQIRQKYTFPVIMLTAKNEEFDRVLGLELGADDYIAKPFSVRELLARIKAVLRRSTGEDGTEGEVLQAGDIMMDLPRHEVSKGGEPLRLTYKEFELLKLLMGNEGKVLTRDFLLNKIWGYDYYGETRTVDVHIRNLRKLLGDDEEKYIKTVRGVGYKLQIDGESL
mgnify:CR=1 FL=1